MRTLFELSIRRRDVGAAPSLFVLLAEIQTGAIEKLETSKGDGARSECKNVRILTDQNLLLFLVSVKTPSLIHQSGRCTPGDGFGQVKQIPPLPHSGRGGQEM